MKYNNGDMDDLFRRASEGYPLRTDSADWDRLAGALNDEPGPPSDQEEKRRRRGAFWWFLLIPLAGVGYLTWQVGVHHSMAGSGGAGVVAAAPSGKVTAPVTGRGGGADGKGGGAARGGGGGVAATREEVRELRTRVDSGASVGDVHKSEMGSKSGSEGVVTDADGSGRGDKRVSGGGKVRSLRTRDDGGTDVAGRSGTDVAGSRGTEVEARRGTEVEGPSRVEAVGKDGEVDHDAALAALDLRRAPIGGSYHVDVNVVAPKAAANNTVPAAKKHSHGYIGVFGAPDFSTVRFQTMKGVGTTFGVLLGYSFNERWAVETGLSLDEKKYYTAGEYFKVTMQSGYNLLNVDGTCNMWEIPVNVRYNFNASPKMRWFATAGFSTYLMSRENYTYQYEYNWTTGDSSWDIHKPSQYWFSIINLSAGFEQRIGKIGNLRLEPYVRIPLSGIGTGKLPILSAGVNIGFTHQLW
jgi:hypothetical protein